MHPFDQLREKPWPSTRPADFADIITMLKGAELAMLRYLTGSYYRAEGSIIDAGCFVGGSTVALAAGLHESRKPGMIYSYDRFIAPDDAPVMNKMIGVKGGESFRACYEKQIAPYQNIIQTYMGDFTQQIIPDGPVEILFIDLAKSYVVNDYIVSILFPRLIPGRSVVVHQDYLYYGLPWIHVTMESLANEFSIVCHEANSVVFGCTRQIPKAKASMSTWSAISSPERAELMDRAIEHWSGRERLFLEETRAAAIF